MGACLKDNRSDAPARPEADSGLYRAKYVFRMMAARITSTATMMGTVLALLRRVCQTDWSRK